MYRPEARDQFIEVLARLPKPKSAAAWLRKNLPGEQTPTALTLRNWMEDPDFQARVQEKMQELQAQPKKRTDRAELLRKLAMSSGCLGAAPAADAPTPAPAAPAQQALRDPAARSDAADVAPGKRPRAERVKAPAPRPFVVPAEPRLSSRLERLEAYGWQLFDQLALAIETKGMPAEELLKFWKTVQDFVVRLRSRATMVVAEMFEAEVLVEAMDEVLADRFGAAGAADVRRDITRAYLKLLAQRSAERERQRAEAGAVVELDKSPAATAETPPDGPAGPASPTAAPIPAGSAAAVP